MGGGGRNELLKNQKGDFRINESFLPARCTEHDAWKKSRDLVSILTRNLWNSLFAIKNKSGNVL